MDERRDQNSTPTLLGPTLLQLFDDHCLFSFVPLPAEVTTDRSVTICESTHDDEMKLWMAKQLLAASRWGRVFRIGCSAAEATKSEMHKVTVSVSVCLSVAWQ